MQRRDQRAIVVAGDHAHPLAHPNAADRQRPINQRGHAIGDRVDGRRFATRRPELDPREAERRRPPTAASAAKRHPFSGVRQKQVTSAPRRRARARNPSSRRHEQRVIRLRIDDGQPSMPMSDQILGGRRAGGIIVGDDRRRRNSRQAVRWPRQREFSRANRATRFGSMLAWSPASAPNRIRPSGASLSRRTAVARRVGDMSKAKRASGLRQRGLHPVDRGGHRRQRHQRPIQPQGHHGDVASGQLAGRVESAMRLAALVLELTGDLSNSSGTLLADRRIAH